MPKPSESKYFKTGKKFGSFKTRDIENRIINIKEEKGKIIVLNFWFLDCPPCRMEIPALNDMVEYFKDNDSVKFIAVALDGRPEIVKFLKFFPFTYDIVENGQYIANRFGVRAYPTHVIIDQEGEVYFHTTGLGLNTVYWLKKSITELLIAGPRLEADTSK